MATDVSSIFSNITSGLAGMKPMTLIGILAVIFIAVFIYAMVRQRRPAAGMYGAGAQKPASWWKDKGVSELMIVSILVLVFLQLVGWLLPSILSKFGVQMDPLKLGPLFMLLIIGAGVALVYSLVIKGSKDKSFTSEDYVVIGIVVVFIIALIVILPLVVPQVFSVAADELRETIITQTQSIMQSIFGG